MKKAESLLWGRMRKGLEGIAMPQRIENMVGQGVPDVWMNSMTGVGAWVELKHASQFPAQPNTPVFGRAGLRPEQIAWIYWRAKCGAKVYIVAQVQDRIFVAHGTWAREFNQMTRSELEACAALVSDAVRTNWGRVADVLFS